MTSRSSYHSALRQQQAAATRESIIDAGRTLFIENGYAKTTMADIAAHAGVAVPTVYASVGTKPAILDELRKRMPAEAGVVPQEIGAELAALSEPSALIRTLTAGVRRLVETSGDLLHAIEAAAPFEPVAAAAWEEGLAIHRAGWWFVGERLVALGALDKASAGRAADIMSLISLPTSWRTLARKYGWSLDEVESWINDTALALAPGKAP